MKAIVRFEYGPPAVLSLEDVDPPDVGEHDVLVRVHAASANPYDWHYLTGLPYVGRIGFGLFKPNGRGLGADLSGRVEAVGANVTHVRPGDDVFGQVGDEAVNKRSAGFTSFAEYVCVSEDSVVPMPSNLTFEEAAAVPMAATTALQGLRDQGRIEAGQEVLINGASGGVGTFAVQIARSFGARVTGVCSTRNVDLVRGLGAVRVIDYTREDFTRSDRRYDLIMDTVGNRSPNAVRRVMRPEGVYVASFGSPENRWLGPILQLIGILAMGLIVSQRMVTWVSKPNHGDLLLLKELIETGKVVPVVDRTHPLSEAADALRYLEEGHARGKVVLAA